jgi:hypothetical protein
MQAFQIIFMALAKVGGSRVSITTVDEQDSPAQLLQSRCCTLYSG